MAADCQTATQEASKDFYALLNQKAKDSELRHNVL